MKKFISILSIAAVAALAFVSCDKDDDKDNGGKELGAAEKAMCTDIGLSVYWANCNLGAKSPADYGDYYAWGELNPKSKDKFTLNNYAWYKDGKMSKYNKAGTTLEAGDDAAHNYPDYINLSKYWRMPTDAEWQELVSTKGFNEDYKWEWITLDDHEGYKITYLKNNNSIFLPAAGYMKDGSDEFVNFAGTYWSSSLKDEQSAVTMCLFGVPGTGKDGYSRYWGLSIRAVREK